MKIILVIIGLGLIAWGYSFVLDSKENPFNILLGLVIMAFGAGLLGCV